MLYSIGYHSIEEKNTIQIMYYLQLNDDLKL